MSEQPVLSDDDRAELVAYLDGELSEEAARRVEARISQNPVIRAEVESLRRTWELLDYLPRAEPSPSFTNRTLERISVQRVAAFRARRRWLHLALALGWVAAVLLAAATGFVAVVWLVPREPTDEELARDLRLLENRRLYEAVDSLEFLRDLDHPDLFGEDPP